ncbi:helix-turn-helix transcriptional regulator [Bacillus sp. FJAT-27264]|nr:helix-turn-helix transcriptional regulator [Bacillus sp. FJAT-27264]
MEGFKSGYGLKKTFDSSVGIYHMGGFGSLYPVLKRLTDKGMIEKQC